MWNGHFVLPLLNSLAKKTYLYANKINIKNRQCRQTDRQNVKSVNSLSLLSTTIPTENLLLEEDEKGHEQLQEPYSFTPYLADFSFKTAFLEQLQIGSDGPGHILVSLHQLIPETVSLGSIPYAELSSSGNGVWQFHTETIHSKSEGIQSGTTSFSFNEKEGALAAGLKQQLENIPSTNAEEAALETIKKDEQAALEKEEIKDAGLVGDLRAIQQLEERARAIISEQTQIIKTLHIDLQSAPKEQKAALEEELIQRTQKKAGAENFLLEIATLRKSTVVYNIEIQPATLDTDGKGGLIEPAEDPSYNTINVIVYGDLNQFTENKILGRLAHELKHAYQYETGELTFLLSDKGVKTYDAGDEVEAYQRQKDLSLNTVLIKGVIDNKSIKKLGYRLPQGPLNVNTILEENYTIGDRMRINTWQAGAKERRTKKTQPIPYMYNGWQIDYQLGLEAKPPR